MLTILGVIMFMRAGFVVGDSGVWRALLILVFAKAITTLTTLSLSAIATNTEVGPGGNYFMISRSLGPDIGGTIGITLFVSQAVAIAFYVIGFSEALFGLIAPPGTQLAVDLAALRVPQLVSSGVIALLFVLTFKGADVALRAQYIILVVLLASVVSFLVGGALAFDSAQFEANTGPVSTTVGFWTAFAIFFPAATGIDAGANMSGDLKDPARSIPRGTLLAIVFTGAVYTALLVLTAGYTDAASLIADPFGELQRMSVFGPLVIAGVFAATLSSALSSFLGAPRILQAMGKDELLKPLVYFAKGHGAADEPRRATVLSFVIALGIVWAGGLNAIAEIISMFFLISYGMINISAFVEGRSGNPSFRPRFRLFGWPAAIVAAVGCGIAMVKINETYAIAAMVLAGLIYWSLRGRTKSSWSDAWAGYTFTRTCENLFELEDVSPTPKNWKPIVVAVTQDAARDERMIQHAAWLEAGRGLFSVLEVTTAPDRGPAERAEIRSRRLPELRAALRYQRLKCLADTLCVREHDDIDGVLQSYSVGALRPNTVVLTLPPPGALDRRTWLREAVASAGPLPVNLILYKGAKGERPGAGRIDIWWAGETNGSLMVLCAYLISLSDRWKNSVLRLNRIVRDASEQLDATRSLEGLAADARIDLDVEVILSRAPVADVICERSATASLVVMGLAQRDVDDIDPFLDRNDTMFRQLPPTLVVHSNGDVDLSA